MRLFWLLLALAYAATASVAVAQDNTCGSARGISVREARLVITPDMVSEKAKLTLSANATIQNAEHAIFDTAAALCKATLGENFSVNDANVCEQFAEHNGALATPDRIEPAEDGIAFVLSQSVDQKIPDVIVRLPEGKSICAERLIVEVRPGRRGRFTYVAPMPRFLGEDRTEFEISRGTPRPLDLFVGFEDQEPTQQERHFVGPKSWKDSFDFGSKQLLQAFLVSITIILLFTYLEKNYALPIGPTSAQIYIEIPVTAAIAFFLSSPFIRTILDISTWLARRLLNYPNMQRWIRENFTADFLNLLDPLLSFALSIFAFLLFVCFYFILRLSLQRRSLPEQAILLQCRVILFASLISTVALLVSTGLWYLQSRLGWMGFEAPALLLSGLYAFAAASTLKTVYSLRLRSIVGIALLVAVTVLFPTDPVVRGATTVSIAQNTIYWAIFLGYPVASFLYIAALTGFAYRIAKDSTLLGALAAKWLVILLILEIASFSMTSPTNAAAIAGVVLVSSRWIVTQQISMPQGQPADQTRAATQAINWGRHDSTFLFVVGGSAAFIFLMQYIFRAGGSGAPESFALLGLGSVPRTFAIGVTAGLVISRGGPYLRGDSAALKALNVGFLVFATNLAASLDSLRGREALIATLTEYMGLIAALVLSAAMIYDLQRATTTDGHLQWRDLFKGTTLAAAIPIVSAVAVAVFSALSPILINEIGASFGVLLKTALPHVASGN